MNSESLNGATAFESFANREALSAELLDELLLIIRDPDQEPADRIAAIAAAMDLLSFVPA